MLKSNSTEMQDLFAYYVINSETGTFLDLGAGGREPEIASNLGSNTYLLESIGWTGTLVDIRSIAIDWFKENRKSSSYCMDLSKEESINELSNIIEFPVDYISFDIDKASLNCLKYFVDKKLHFKCMTYEHDQFRYQNYWQPQSLSTERDISRDMIRSLGPNYKLLFSDVFWMGPGHRDYHDGNRIHLNYSSFEDWWINLDYIDEDIMEISSTEILYSDCISKLKDYRENK